MKFATSFILALAISVVGNVANAKNISELIRDVAKKNGLTAPSKVNEPFDTELADIGKTIFNSTAFSLNGKISCQTCHLDKFGSADGIPNAIGVGGVGEGAARVIKGGSVVPRNTLPLWGRGWSQFRTFFWDGKVDFSDGKRISQFGEKAPSDDPLQIAIHLPVVEIREMLAEDKFISKQKAENVESANAIYSAVIKKLINKHPKEMSRLATRFQKGVLDITFAEISLAVRDFIRRKFAIKPYKFSRFVFENGSLSSSELKGATIFYGKGKCSVCHSGPLLSDADFHVIPFEQLGAGKNGFGVDYGRFNVTHNPKDLYKFRTPPLLNISKTAPYGHSGSLPNIADAIVMHFDPLRHVDIKQTDQIERAEIYKKIGAASFAFSLIPALNQTEVSQLELFLRTLSF
jgi:cytochrome c peroxidase